MEVCHAAEYRRSQFLLTSFESRDVVSRMFSSDRPSNAPRNSPAPSIRLALIWIHVVPVPQHDVAHN